MRNVFRVQFSGNGCETRLECVYVMTVKQTWLVLVHFCFGSCLALALALSPFFSYLLSPSLCRAYYSQNNKVPNTLAAHIQSTMVHCL